MGIVGIFRNEVTHTPKGILYKFRINGVFEGVSFENLTVNILVGDDGGKSIPYLDMCYLPTNNPATEEAIIKACVLPS